MKPSLRFLLLVTILSLVLIGCSQTGSTSDAQRPAIEIASLSSGIGAVEGKGDIHNVQRYSYNITLANNDKEEVFVREIQLVLPSEFEERLLTKSLQVPVNKSIAPKSFINISDTLDFNAAGFSKDDILKLNPHIASVKVISEKMISLDKWFR